MAIRTDVNRKLVQEVLNIYLNAENKMLNKVNKRIKRGILIEGWNEKKYNDVLSLRIELQHAMKEISKSSEAKLTEATYSAYKQGVNSANKDFGITPIPLKDIRIPISMQRLVQDQMQVLKNTDVTILRNVNDIYREVIGEVSSGTLVGVDTRRQAAQNALNRFANSGIKGFVDKAGRVWSMASYTEMATRATISHAAIQGHIDRQKELGRDLVIVSDHGKECPVCRPWENKVLSISGNDPDYDSLQTAISAGLFHPNCKHTLTGYIPGLTKIQHTTEAEKKRSAEGYVILQKQRYNERNIRKWKRREAVALDPLEEMRSKAKIKEWQVKQRKLVKEHDLRRKYERESFGKAR